MAKLTKKEKKQKEKEMAAAEANKKSAVAKAGKEEKGLDMAELSK